MSKQVLIFSKIKNREADLTVKKLQQWLKINSYESIDITKEKGRLPEKKLKDVALAVAIGGDGTFLQLVKRIEKKDQFPVLGINLGTKGFITEFGEEEMIPQIKKVLATNYKEDHRQLLHVKVLRNGKQKEADFVLNDVVISKGAQTTTVGLEVKIEKNILTRVKADGYIVATSTGSTAYALSAGGPLVHPAVKAVILVPICFHSLSSRPIIVPYGEEVEVLIREANGPAFVVFDGQLNFELKEGDRIVVTGTKTTVRLVTDENKVWSQALKSKLDMN